MYDITNYIEAKTILEASNALKENIGSKIICGGTDVLIKSRERKNGYTNIAFIGITRIDELKELYLDEEKNIIIGSACTFTQIENSEIINEHISFVAKACGTVGGPQVRNQGTIGGNICNGATSADSATSLFALNAILVIQNGEHRREVSIHEFYVSAGKVNLDVGDVLVCFKISKENYQGFKGDYIKFAQRNAMDIATVNCSALIKVKENIIEDLRLCFGVIAPTPKRMKTAEGFAKGKAFTEETVNEISKLALEDSNARNSWRASKEYRENLIEVLSKRAILNAKGGN